MSETVIYDVHRKIRAVVRASDSEEAIDACVTGLENAMEENILATGTVSTLVGNHTMFSPSTYFPPNRQEAGHTITSRQGRDDLEQAIHFTKQKSNCFLYEIETMDTPRANPIPTENAATEMKQQIKNKDEPHWIVTFDLRYDYDANPYKSYEVLD